MMAFVRYKMKEIAWNQVERLPGSQNLVGKLNAPAILLDRVVLVVLVARKFLNKIAIILVACGLGHILHVGIATQPLLMLMTFLYQTEVSKRRLPCHKDMHLLVQTTITMFAVYHRGSVEGVML